jgi:predicted acylesterase/phospholipase RssA
VIHLKEYSSNFILFFFTMHAHSSALPCSGCTEVDDVNKPPFNLGALSISFSGCGFLGIYHMGVVAALRQYLPDLRVIKVAGCSAGALAAVSLLLDTPLGE